MGHHAGEHDEEMQAAMRKSLMDSIPRETLEDQMQKLTDKLGPTGEFPDGKITEKDRGEIRIVVGAKEGRIVLYFGARIEWLGMTVAQAYDIAASIVQHAREIEGGPLGAEADRG